MSRKKNIKAYDRKNVTLEKPKKIVLSEEEKKEYEEKLERERKKYERDVKCGGIDAVGNYTRLHDRVDK